MTVRRRTYSLIACLLAGLAVQVHAGASAGPQAPPQVCAPIATGTANLGGAVTPFGLELAGGRTLHLAEIALPEDPALLNIAVSTLEAAVQSGPISLWADAPSTDRHGRLVAHGFVLDGRTRIWLQEALVDAGLAYVDTSLSHRACAAELLAAEAKARQARHGIWGAGVVEVLSPEEAAERRTSGGFLIVEGKVLSVQTAGRTTYLNFGKDWSQDVTATLTPKALAALKREGLDVFALEGAVVRLRGYAVPRRGPEIAVTHKEQIETVKAARPSPPPSDKKPD